MIDNLLTKDEFSVMCDVNLALDMVSFYRKTRRRKMRFSNVYFIIGTAYAGKSTMINRLAEKYHGILCEENYHGSSANFRSSFF